MFEKITLRRSDEGPPITAGELAEALLFYQHVHLVLDYGSLISLILKIGTSNLLSILSRPNISAVYCEDTLATFSEQAFPFNKYSFVAIMAAGNRRTGKLVNKNKILQSLLEDNNIDKKEAKRFVLRFRELVPIKKLISDYFIKGGVGKAALADLNDAEYVHEAVRSTLTSKLQRPIGNFEFHILQEDGRFSVTSDLDYSSLTKEIQKKDLQADITEAYLINELFNAQSDTILAGHYGSEFYTASNTSEVIRLKYKFLFRRLDIENQERENFTDIISEGRTLREVINSGERTFLEFLKLLDSSNRFKEWTKGIGPDEKIVTAYFKEISRKGWIDKLPTKVIRYVISGAAGVINPNAGWALSTVDTFIVDKLLNGWRPNHFVDYQLKKFLSKNG